MAIQVYRADPFDNSTAVDLVDLFTGNGVDDTFTLSNKTGLRLGSTIQFDSVQYYRYNGGFTVDGNDFTLSSTPPSSASGVAPGLNCLTLSAFDTDNVDGIVDPRVKEVEFFVGNGTDIYLEFYSGLDDGGLKLQFSTLIDITGQADADWIQLASSVDGGVAGTYLDPGEELYTPPISAFGTITSSVTSLGTEILISSTDDWITGDYILINPGELNSETVQITGQSGSPADALTVTELNYNHDPAEPVYACVRKFYAKMTVPEDATDNEALNFLNVALNIIGKTTARF